MLNFDWLMFWTQNQVIMLNRKQFFAGGGGEIGMLIWSILSSCILIFFCKSIDCKSYET